MITVQFAPSPPAPTPLATAPSSQASILAAILRSAVLWPGVLTAGGLVVGGLGDWTAAVAFARAELGLPRLTDPSNPPPHVERYVQALWLRYDTDGDGMLQPAEWQAMRGEPLQIDADGDRVLQRNEMLSHVLQYAASRRLAPPRAELSRRTEPQPAPQSTAALAPPPPAKTYFVPERLLPTSLPDWFVSLDANGDGQLSLAEYSPTSEAERISQFERLDVNGDGLLTAREANPAGGSGEEPLGNRSEAVAQ